MSERKVLSKYYPADFDPSALGRVRKPKSDGPKVATVRLMAPFSMKCLSCGEYIYKGRKFNARKETPPDMRYLSIQQFRFYIRCTRCSAEITFRTDPKNHDYAIERGAQRNTEPWRRGLGGELDETDEERLDRLEREAADAEAAEEGGGDRDAMAELEASKADAKERMAVADELEEMRYRNARIERAHRDGLEVELPPVAGDDERARQDREDEEAARRAFAFARAHEAFEEPMDEDAAAAAGENGNAGSSSSSSTASVTSASTAPTIASVLVPAPAAAPPPAATKDDMPPPSFKRQIKKKKDHSTLLGIKKKKALV